MWEAGLLQTHSAEELDGFLLRRDINIEEDEMYVTAHRGQASVDNRVERARDPGGPWSASGGLAELPQGDALALEAPTVPLMLGFR